MWRVVIGNAVVDADSRRPWEHARPLGTLEFKWLRSNPSNSRQGQRGERGTRRAETSGASGGAAAGGLPCEGRRPSSCLQINPPKLSQTSPPLTPGHGWTLGSRCEVVTRETEGPQFGTAERSLRRAGMRPEIMSRPSPGRGFLTFRGGTRGTFSVLFGDASVYDEAVDCRTAQ